MSALRVLQTRDERKTLDDVVFTSMGTATGVVALLMVAFALADPFIYDSPDRFRIALADALVAAGFGVAWLAMRKGLARARHAHAIAVGLTTLVTADIVHDTWTMQTPDEALYLILILVGVGAYVLNTRWMLATIALVGAAFGAMVMLVPAARWSTLGIALLAAAVFGTMVHEVRVRTYLRLEASRHREAQRMEELEIREETLHGVVTALQESEDRYRNLVEQAPDAFLVLSEGAIRYANPAAVKLFGARDANDLVGRDPLTLVHPDDRERVAARTLQIEQDRRGTEFAEVRLRRLDGSIVEVETLGQPITFMGKPADQTIIHDVSDRRRAEAERMRAVTSAAEVERLRDMDRIKTQFVNTISHELRTPLTPVKVQLHILKRGIPAKETYEKSISVLERNFTRLNSLVDELLEVARIQAGTLKLARTYVDLNDTLTQALESYHDVAIQNGVELASDVPRGLEVLGDPKRLSQVIYNLLGNAFKFTPRGGRVRVEARLEGDDVVVAIHDTGIGLSEADALRLFEPFSQAHDVMEKTQAGTGLGLYISRGIVEGHGGEIWARSDGPGLGASFGFRLPRATHPEASALAAPQKKV